MDGLMSSCHQLTSSLKDSGLSHAQLCELMSRLRTEGILTKLGYEQVLACFESNSVPELPSTFASEETLDSLMPKAFDTLGSSSTHFQSSSEVSTHTSAELKTFKRVHNQAFNLDSRTDKKSLAQRCLNSFTNNRISFRAANSVSGNIFLGSAYVARALLSGQPQDARTESATLLLDTGSDFNIISLNLAKRLITEFAFKGESSKLANTGGGYMYTWGRSAFRWLHQGGASGKKFVESTFYVSTKELDVDVIIGWQEIVRLKLVSLKPRLSFVGFNSKPPSVNKRTVAIEEAAAVARRRAEEVEMNDDASNQHLIQRRSAYAHEQARLHVESFTIQYRALHGEVGLQEACRVKYDQVYKYFNGTRV